jgi:hypothetical protein
MAIWRTTIFVERWPGSPREAFANDRSVAERVYDVAPYTARVKAVEDFIGFATVLTKNGGKYVHRQTPHYHPDWTDEYNNYFLYATEVSSIEGIATPITAGQTFPNLKEPGVDVSNYLKARLTVKYESLTYDILEDNQVAADSFGNPDESALTRYVTPTWKPQADYLTLPTGTYYFVGLAGPVAVSRGIGKILVNYDVSLKWHLVPPACVGTTLVNPALTTPSIDLALGKVNKADCFGYKKGTLLLLAAEIERRRSPLGDRIYDITYRFKFFNPTGSGNVGHQFILRPEDNPATWREVVTSNANPPVTNLVAQTAGVNPYDYADMLALFRVPS